MIKVDPEVFSILSFFIILIIFLCEKEPNTLFLHKCTHVNKKNSSAENTIKPTILISLQGHICC